MIYCVWFPSGGFGHFISHVVNCYGHNFVRPDVLQIKFGSDGNAHSARHSAPKYNCDPETYHFDFDSAHNYTVLIDNGINNQGEKFRKFFPEATVIKIAYVDTSWPVVARTVIDKVIQNSLEKELPLDLALWPSLDNWAQREKYFLYLRDHAFRQWWKPSLTDQNLLIDHMLDYNTLIKKFNGIGIELAPFEQVWKEWRCANAIYVDPVIQAQQIILDVKHNKQNDLTYITDLWEQAVVYYFIWLEFGQEVPHNDYSNFFSNTTEIRRWLKL
jgi:hypothetical protein